MSGADTGHGSFRELAAGYALNALDPADEERFLRHATACPECLEQIAGFQEVAAALAETAPAAEPSSDLGDRILAATQPGPAGAGPADTGPAQAGPGQAGAEESGLAQTEPTDARPGSGTVPPGVVPLQQRRLRRAAMAAAAAVVAVVGIWGGLAATSGGTSGPLAVCSRPHTCTEVPLVATATHRVAAKVVVLGREVWMLPGAMTASPKDEIYVLWQITGSQAPRAVGSFDIRTGSNAPIRIGGLAAPAAGSTAFAVSLEHGLTIPAAPSNKLAAGQVS
ncbi:MAG TPA: zf-HC2 domain-containing protein [Streptosporangiaceae bacterium]|jgi:anti-sigma-K factor RskA